MRFKKKTSMTAALVLGAALALMAAQQPARAQAAAAPTVTVPDLDGKCFDDIDRTLRAAGLRAKATDVHGPVDADAASMGCAYRQSPKAGARVPRGSTVRYRSWYEAG